MWHGKFEIVGTAFVSVLSNSIGGGVPTNISGVQPSRGRPRQRLPKEKEKRQITASQQSVGGGSIQYGAQRFVYQEPLLVEVSTSHRGGGNLRGAPRKVYLDHRPPLDSASISSRGGTIAVNSRVFQEKPEVLKAPSREGDIFLRGGFQGVRGGVIQCNGAFRGALNGRSRGRNRGLRRNS